MAAAAQSATRRQLDELDALLEKMLARPGSAPVEAPRQPPPPNPVPEPTPLAQKLAGLMSGPPAPPKFPTPAVAYGVPPAVAFASSPMTVPPPAAPTRPPGWAIELNPREGSSVIANRETPPAPPLATLNVTPIAPPTPVSAASEASMCLPLSMRPLAWINAGYDRFVTNFIPLGWLLTGPAFRTLLGYCGVAMLSASLIWAVMLWVGGRGSARP